MSFAFAVWPRLIPALLLSCMLSWLLTPPVKKFAERIGAIDSPDSERRVHDHPIPRMGGLAIYLGFVAAVLIFADMNGQVTGMLLGSVAIAVMGAVDDIVNLKAWVKLLVQIAAALIAVRFGLVFGVVSSPNPIDGPAFISVGYFAVPLTVLWIVGCTNAVNLIDGLDGLAVGVSAISSLTMLVVSLFVSEANVAVLLGALVGACLGFIPYNLNPAKIFMGDVGSQLLGFLLATISIMGLFKFHAIVTFLVPVLAMFIPIADTAFAFFRRLLRGQSPFHPDRGHLHHRLLAVGLSQKQAVAVLYGISAVLGLLAVLLTGKAAGVRIVCIALAFVISVCVWFFVFRHNKALHRPDNTGKEE